MEGKIVNGSLTGNLSDVNPQKTDFKYLDFMKLYSPSGTGEQLGFALFGLGKAGTIHLENLLSNHRVNLKYAVEGVPARRKEVENLLGVSAKSIKFVGVENIDTILKDDSLHAVVITTPTPTHFGLVMKALENGKVVLCEKPVADSLAELKQLYQKAKEAGRPLMCGFNRRFDPSFRNIAERVHAGELGKVHMIKTCARDSPMPPLGYITASSGMIHDCGIHDIDMICHALKEFPKRVFATGTAHIKEIAAVNDIDTASLQMIFPSGAIAHTDLSRFAVYGYDQRIEVFGPGGMLQANNQVQVGVQTFKRDGVREEPIYYSFPSRYSDSYKKVLEHFLDVVEGKAELIVTGDQVINVCRVAAALTKSVKTGQPVDITYD